MERNDAFTLVELLVVVAIVGVLSSILLPALAKSRTRTQGILCLNNTKQLAVAWLLYADDHDGKLAYNVSATNTALKAQNWVDNVLTWGLDPDNTNAAAMMKSGLGPYSGKTAAAYRCPADYVLSTEQQQSGWNSRVRSYSLNGMLGDLGNLQQPDFNPDNPNYLQILKLSAVTRPTEVFVFLDEHPASISDGSFLNNADSPQWHSLPASYHDGVSGFSFADGHSEPHRWRHASTKPPSVAAAVRLPVTIAPREVQDYVWLLSTSSLQRRSDNYHY